MPTPLYDALHEFLRGGYLPFTTPGHKRNPDVADQFLLLDAPLPGGVDDLSESRGLRVAAERLAADLWGADYARFALNGSTEGNQALVLAVCRPGKPVVVSRIMHKSIFAGLVLADADPVWVRPSVDPRTGLPHAIDATALEAAFALADGATGAFIVNPTYVGACADVGALASTAHRHGAPLIVDQAWGAHLGFHPELPAHALQDGADAFVTSTHKGLPAFTQSAMVASREGRIDLGRLDEAIELLHTTSPSGTILASIDRAREILGTRGEAMIGAILPAVRSARERLAAVPGVIVLDGPPAEYDPLKLVIILHGSGADGVAIERELERKRVRFENADRETLVPQITFSDRPADIERLVDLLVAAIEAHRGEPRPAAASAGWIAMPEQAMRPRQAFFAQRESVSHARAIGRVAAEMVVPYPPGIPAIAPGEVISAEIVAALRAEAASGKRIAYCADPTLETLKVVAV